MPPTPKYCSQCAAAVESRVVAGNPRLVCPQCDTVFYDNPIPVAAAVVLNERRQVLLVKRKRAPHQGDWCLPMGFVESGETITAAAVRELREETGLEGHVVRLLEVDSLPNDELGDALIVTFELHKIAGTELPGDDAEEVRYFPLSQCPPLPFSSNERALRICAQTHLESWAIQDSFVTLQAREDKVMLSDGLVTMIEAHCPDIVGHWLEEVRNSPTTRAYHHLDPAHLTERATTAITQFSRWLKGSEAIKEVRDFYRAIGAERRDQNFALTETISVLTLLKKHIWDFTLSHSARERPIDLYRCLELGRRIAMFFDQAVYHAARGYEACPDAGK
ncbi:MAG: NUDIX domain-containing protein [Planctomycetota bacterium]